MDDDYVNDQAAGWIEIGKFHHEYDRNPPDKRPETADGPGATRAITEDLRDWLGDVIRRHKIGTMLDVACGDWSWMRLVDLGRTEYTGWDVDPGRVETCRQRVVNGDFTGCSDGPDDWLAEMNLAANRPNAQFETKNLLTVEPADLGNWDLVLARDVLMHITNEHVATFINKVRDGESLLLLATTFPGADNSVRAYDPDKATWQGYMEQAIDLTTAPFNLPQPIESFQEKPGPWGILAVPRELALFKLN